MAETEPVFFSFVKLVVSDLEAATQFFAEGFGLSHSDTLDRPDFCEHMMTGKKGTTTLVLFHWKDGRPIRTGNAHGPIGLISKDLERDLDRAVAAGAIQDGPVMDAKFAKVVFLRTPDDHQIEILQRKSSG